MTASGRRIFGLFSMAALALCATNAEAQSVAVRIKQGVLNGSAVDGGVVFKNIPYAAPPVGPLRWRPPAPALNWQGARDATKIGPACVQPLSPAASIYGEDPPAMSEDCLSLNVWAPNHAQRLPVIVWIFGGSLTRGSTANPIYDGANFAHHGVVFVSINYRLGVLGYLAHPGLSAESPHGVSGNYGLLDQIQALHWVHDNIAAFGGDPGNVTIMGESAGALSVTYLLSSPLANGLFQKAIAESANMRAFPMLKQAAHGLPSAESIGSDLAKAAGAADVAALRAMDAKALVRVAFQQRFRPEGTIDGWALPAQIPDIWDGGRQAHVPILTGFNSSDVQLGAAVPQDAASQSTYESQVRQRYGALAPAFLKAYPASNLRASTRGAARDALFGWASERMVRKQAALGLPSYLYFYDHVYPAADARHLGAFHASEVPFVFGQVGPNAALSPKWPRPDGPNEQALSDAMMAYWTSFAKTGVPHAPGAPDWRPFSDNGAYMLFQQRPVASTDLLPGTFEVQETIAAQRRKAGDTQWSVGVSVPVGGAAAGGIE